MSLNIIAIKKKPEFLNAPSPANVCNKSRLYSLVVLKKHVFLKKDAHKSNLYGIFLTSDLIYFCSRKKRENNGTSFFISKLKSCTLLQYFCC